MYLIYSPLRQGPRAHFVDQAGLLIEIHLPPPKCWGQRLA